MKRIVMVHIIIGFSMGIAYSQKLDRSESPKMINKLTTIDSLMKTHKVSFLKFGISFLPSINYETNLSKKTSLVLKYKFTPIDIYFNPKHTLGLQMKYYFKYYPRGLYAIGSANLLNENVTYPFGVDREKNYAFDAGLGLGIQTFILNSKYPMDFYCLLKYIGENENLYGNIFATSIVPNLGLSLGFPILKKKKINKTITS